MINFSRQEILPLFGLLAVGHVNGHAADAHNPTRRIDAGSRGAGAPSCFAVGAKHAELGVLGSCALRHAVYGLLERSPVFRMNEVAGVLHCRLKPPRINAEDATLSLVPVQFRAADLPLPRTHLSRRKRQAASLFALYEPGVRRFKLRSALGDPLLQLYVHLLEFARLAE